MTHPLVLQLRFTRSEFVRGMEGVPDEDARRRFEPMNCISWIVGHLAWQEQLYWLTRGQEQTPLPELNELVGIGKPASTPPLDEMWSAWHTITQDSDAYLDTLTVEVLETHLILNGQPHRDSLGTMVQRTNYHYWYHLGEAQAIRQLLNHHNLPQFIGAIQAEAPYKRE
ncbi:MAG: DinB family protein [Anaerolineae bacterium]|nr:DinB family protein [Anaerolineae bacterium]